MPTALPDSSLRWAPPARVKTPLKIFATQPLRGVQILCFDITRDGQHLGPLFDMIIYPAE